MFSDKVKEVTKKLYIFVTQINHELYLDRNGFKLHLDCIFPSGLRGGTGQARIFRRHGRISGDYQFYFRFFQNGVRNLIGTDGGVVALAGHHEDWRKGRGYPAFRPPAESAVFETVSGDSERASGDGKYFHEPGGEYAGAGQCGHTARPESHGGLQELNPRKDTASNPMIMFLVLNTSGLTLIPISIMVYRAQMGAAQPTDVFVPILLATFFSTMAGIIAVSLYQRINLLNRTILLFLGGASLLIAGIIWLFLQLSREQIDLYSTTFANVFLFLVIIGFIVSGMRKRINVYDAFVEGAKEGFSTAVRIIPYLVAILVSIGVFRASGAMDFLIQGIAGWYGVAE